MTKTKLVRSVGILVLSGYSAIAAATLVPLDTTNPQNGIPQIYSATFDGSISPCGGGSPAYCPFFGGDPPATRNLTIVPSPTGVINGVPDGFTTPPPAGSSLDLTLNATHDQVTLAGGTVMFPTLSIVIDQGTANQTSITASGAGMVFQPPGGPIAGAFTPSGGGSTGGTVPVDGSRRAVFEVNLAPALAVDFSTLGVIVTPANCTGPLCALVQVLTLDMIRYLLVIDYDPTFTSFTASLIGQTANNSMLFANLISGVSGPKIAVTDSVAPAADLLVPFGNVAPGGQADQSITVTNTGSADLTIGQVAAADPLAAPFSVVTDACSAQVLIPNATCNVAIRFAPTVAGPFNDTLDIPSDDPDQPSITVSVTGTGGTVPVIVVTDDVAPSDDQVVQFGNVVESASFDHTVTVTNNGTVDLAVGNIAVADPLAAPFSVVTDNCSAQAIAPAANCTVILRFAPVAVAAFDDSFDIPSNDPSQPSVTVMVHGTGIAAGGGNPVPTPIPTGANPGLFGSAVDPGSLLALALFGVAYVRRSRR